MKGLALPWHRTTPDVVGTPAWDGDDVHVVCCEDPRVRLCGEAADGEWVEDDTPVTCVVCAEGDEVLSQLYEDEPCGLWCPLRMWKECT